VIATGIVTASEDAAQMLLEADLRLFGYASGVGIEGAEKILNLLLDLLIARRR
jgi:hypothetical protein